MARGGPFDEAGRATAEGGQVLIDGPDGIAFALTPDSAEEMGKRMIAAAAEARGQAAPTPEADERGQ